MAKQILSPTIIDVAKAAGVSKSTASRALTGNPNVASKTKAKVLRAAKKLNYKPDMAFSLLGSRSKEKTNKDKLIPIALVYGDDVNKSHIEDIVGFIAKHVHDFGFYLERVPITSKDSPEKIHKQLYDLGIMGIIFYSMKNLDIINEIDLSRYSVISTHRGRENTSHQFNTVRTDHFNDVIYAWNKALEHGHKRIGAAICRQKVSSYDDALRYGAVCECLDLWKEQIEFIPPFRGYLSDKDEFLEWYYKYKPTCIIGFQVSLYWYLHIEGVKIPEEASFITLNRESAINVKNFSGLNDSEEQSIISCLSQLDLQMRNRVRGYPEQPQSTYISSTWNDGETLSTI